MTAYEQALHERTSTSAELDRIANEIQELDQRYANMEQTAFDTAVPYQEREQEKNRLAQKRTLLLTERTRWLDAHAEAEQAVRREIERRVFEWRGEQVRQEQALEAATTIAEAQAAAQRRDHARAEMQRHARELAEGATD